MKKLWMVFLVFVMAFVPSLAYGQNLVVKERKRNLTELERLLKLPKQRAQRLSPDLLHRRKVVTVTCRINQKYLKPEYDARNEVTGYRFYLHDFFFRVIETKPKDFYYPLRINAIKIHYQGDADSTLGYNGPREYARFYSYYKTKARYMFPRNPHNYTTKLYLYFQANDKMTSTISITYLGIDTIGLGAETPWVTDLKRITPMRELYYKSIPEIPGRKKKDTVFSLLDSLITNIYHKYPKANYKTRKLIENNYRRVWLATIYKMMEEKNLEIKKVLIKIEELDQSYKAKRATWNLNIDIEKEYQLQKQLKQALNLSQVEKYIQSIIREIEKSDSK